MVDEVFGPALFVVVRRLESRLYGGLSDAGRATAIEAIRLGRPAADPEVQEAATRPARQWTAPGRQPRYQVVPAGGPYRVTMRKTGKPGAASVMSASGESAFSPSKNAPVSHAHLRR